MTTAIENISSRPSIKNLPSINSVVAEAMSLFPTSIHQRLIHYSRHCTYRNIALGRNPSMAVVDFIGSHGEGKTAIMADYVLKCAGVSTQTHSPDEVRNTLARHLTVVSGGGITDVADITGLSYIDRETKTTRTARAANFGYEASPWRLVLIDDWTRSLPHVLQGLMSIINTGSYNGFSLDPGSFIVATRNPEGEDYNVSGIDPAQLSRTIPIVYNTTENTFFEQLQAQKIDADIMNFWMRHPELARPRQMTIQPVKEANCSRFRMLFSEIYEFIKHDQACLNEVVNSMFGPEMLAMMLSDMRSEQPIAPEEIVHGWSKAVHDRVNELANKHQDVLTITAQRMAFFLNDPQTKLKTAQMTNVVHFLAALPQDTAFMLSKLLIDPGQPRSDEYAVEIVKISESFPDESNVVKMIINLRASINAKLGK